VDKAHDFEALVNEVLADSDARTAYAENALRRYLAASFELARQGRGVSVRALAAEMGTSVSQVQRLLHHEVGGSLTLRTICRAADVLGLRVKIEALACVDAKASPRAARWHDMSMSKVVPECRVSAKPVAHYGYTTKDDWIESSHSDTERASA
jgi:transcriptional regulator with XRE-family HTH domain